MLKATKLLKVVWAYTAYATGTRVFNLVTVHFFDERKKKSLKTEEEISLCSCYSSCSLATRNTVKYYSEYCY